MVWAYCTERSARSVGEAVGVKPVTSPPMSLESLRPNMLQGHEVIYIRLHIINERDDIWFGESHARVLVPAFGPENLDGVDLGGAVVILANCHGEKNPLARRMLDQGASALIAGEGKNWGATTGKVVGVDKLAQFVIKGLSWGWDASSALALAKHRLLLTSWRKSDRDARRFSIQEVHHV